MDSEQLEPAAEEIRGQRQRIMEAAGREFETKGYGGASVNSIIKAAGASKGGFYHWFPAGKQDLAATLLRETLQISLPDQPLVMQEIIDTGMILAYRMTREASLRAATRLSVAYDAPTTYGTPWPDWIVINSAQLTRAMQAGELEPYADIQMTAYQIAGGWAGLALTGQAIDRNLDAFEARVSSMYRNLFAAIGRHRYVVHLDFSADRGRRLYEQVTSEPPAAP